MADGDTVTVYVDVMKDAREKAAVPQAVIEAVRKRRTAQLRHDLAMADALQTQIKQAGYKCDPQLFIAGHPFGDFWHITWIIWQL